MKRVIFSFGIILLSLMLGMPLPEGGGESSSAEAERELVLTKLSSMPLSFTENRGQWGELTKFRCDAPGATFYFAKGEVAYLLTRETDELVEEEREFLIEMPDKLKRPRYKREGILVLARFVGANTEAEVIGEDMLPHKSNYFYGNDPSNWCTDVPNYSSVRYRNIYPGIDLRYYGDGNSLKYDFIVEPGGDPSLIEIEYDGVDSIWVNDSGELVVATSFGDIVERVPNIYQEIRKVKGGYKKVDSKRFGFLVENYDLNKPLIIDPQLTYSTFLGGSSDDRGCGIAVDGSGNAYLTGETQSSDFPTQNPYQGSFAGVCDVFITKLSQSGDSLIYSTYLGGSDYDCGYGIAVDGSGNAYLTGWTESSDFPTQNPYQGSNAGWEDAFVAKLGDLPDVLFIRGDANSDMDVGMPDAVYILRYKFIPGSPPPSCMKAGDADDDGNVGMPDAVYVLRYKFVPGSPPPPAPFPDCGVDPTSDELGCEAHPCMGGR